MLVIHKPRSAGIMRAESVVGVARVDRKGRYTAEIAASKIALLLAVRANAPARAARVGEQLRSEGME